MGCENGSLYVIIKSRVKEKTIRSVNYEKSITKAKWRSTCRR